jgi:hypothetical protein
MLVEYKCKKTLYLEQCDDDGRLTDKQFAVVKGSCWQEDTEYKYRICGGPDTVRLDRIAPKKKGWIEITKDMLEQYFERLN